MKHNLFSAGCSISDYTKVPTVYGEILANNLNAKYFHRAAGCGSNERVWRVITNDIIEKNLTEEDILTIQYTNINRREFFTKHVYNSSTDSTEDKNFTPLRETYKNGQLFKYKNDAYKWQQAKEEVEFFKLYENNFWSVDLDREVFLTRHYSFLSLLKTFKIRTVFILTEQHLLDLKDDPYIYNKFTQSFENIDTKLFFSINISNLLNNPDYQLENDPFHFNVTGHKTVSQQINILINEKF